MDQPALERYLALSQEVARHNRAYHEHDAPEIADSDYDALVRELRALEAAHPEWAERAADEAGTGSTPAQAVGGAPSAAFQPVTHPTPMTSLDNVFGDAELGEWREKLARAL